MFRYQNTHLARFWPLAPNWDFPIIETLVWDTHVLPSDTGVEQRLVNKGGLPRAEYEISYLVDRHRFRKLQTELLNLGSNPIALPLWQERHIIGHASDDLQYSSMMRRDTGGFGGDDIPIYLGVINGRDPDDWVWFEGEYVGGEAFTHAGPYYHPRGTGLAPNLQITGTNIMPVIIAHIIGTPRVDLVTDSVATVTVRFRSRDSIRATPTGRYPLGEYLGAGMLLEGPDWREKMPVDFEQNLSTYESPMSSTYLIQSRGRRTKTVRSYNWTLIGREKLFEFRSLLSSLKGRAISIWVPSFSDDLALSHSYIAGSTSLPLVAIGMPRRDGGVLPAGMRDIAIRLHSGTTYYARITRVNQGAEAGEETAILEAALPVSISPHEVDRISYLVLSRLAQDRVELHHPTDEKGITTATTSWAHVGAQRVAPNDRPESALSRIPPFDDLLVDPGVGTPESIIGMVTNHPNWDTGTMQQWLNFDSQIAQTMETYSMKEIFDLYVRDYASTINRWARDNGETMGAVSGLLTRESVRRVAAANLMSAPLSPTEIAALTPAPFIYADWNTVYSNDDLPPSFDHRIRSSPTLAAKITASLIMRNRGQLFNEPGPGTRRFPYHNYLYWTLARFQGYKDLPGYNRYANEVVFKARMPATITYTNEVGLVSGRRSEILAATVWGGVHCTEENVLSPSMTNYVRGGGAPDRPIDQHQLVYSSGGLVDDVLIASACRGRQGELTTMQGAIPLTLAEGSMLAATNNPLPPHSATVAGQYNYRSDGYIGPSFSDASVDLVAVAYAARGIHIPSTQAPIIDIIDVDSGEVVHTGRAEYHASRIGRAGLTTTDQVTVRVLGFIVRSSELAPDYTVNALGAPSLLQPGREYLVRVRRF